MFLILLVCPSDILLKFARCGASTAFDGKLGSQPKPHVKREYRKSELDDRQLGYTGPLLLAMLVKLRPWPHRPVQYEPALALKWWACCKQRHRDLQ